MNFELFLEPVELSQIALQLKADSLFHSFFIYETKFPDWKNIDIAIIGVNEYRATQLQPETNGLHKIRKKLYELKQYKHSVKIADLGNIKLGETPTDTYERVAEVCRSLIQEKTIPIIIGGSHDIDLGQFTSYRGIENSLKVAILDSSIDVYEVDSPTENHVRTMLLTEPNYLFNLSHIGHQSFISHPHAPDTLEKMNCDHVRLGEISSDIRKIEPYIRFAQMISVDMAVVKQSDFSCSFNPQPFGLSAEQLCQVGWYAGMSNQCSSFGVYGYNPQLDVRNNDAAVISVIIWYFINGFYHRPKEIYSSEDYIKYTVILKDSNVHFYKDVEREMWWCELKINNGTIMVPCTHEEYIESCKGELPKRLFELELKFI